jgi:hypothetical protein
MAAPAQSRLAACFRVSALVLSTWAGATIFLTGHWWTISIEHLWPMWIPNRAASLGGAVVVGLVSAACIAYGLSARAWIRTLAWGIVACGFVLAASGRLGVRSLPPLSAIAADVAAVSIAAVLTAAWTITYWRPLGFMHLGRQYAERTGVAILLCACLWAAAARTGFLARVYAAGNVDVVLFVPVVLAYLGLLGLTWHGYWRLVSPPQAQLGSEVTGVGPARARQLTDPLARRFALLDMSGPVQKEISDQSRSPR